MDSILQRNLQCLWRVLQITYRFEALEHYSRKFIFNKLLYIRRPSPLLQMPSWKHRNLTVQATNIHILPPNIKVIRLVLDPRRFLFKKMLWYIPVKWNIIPRLSPANANDFFEALEPWSSGSLFKQSYATYSMIYSGACIANVTSIGCEFLWKHLNSIHLVFDSRIFRIKKLLHDIG